MPDYPLLGIDDRLFSSSLARGTIALTAPRSPGPLATPPASTLSYLYLAGDDHKSDLEDLVAFASRTAAQLGAFGEDLLWMQEIGYEDPLGYLKCFANGLQNEFFDEPDKRIHDDCKPLSQGYTSGRAESCGVTYFVETCLFALKFVTLPDTMLVTALKAGPEMLGERGLISPERVAADKRIIDLAFFAKSISLLLTRTRSLYKAYDEIKTNPGKKVITKAGEQKKGTILYRQQQALDKAGHEVLDDVRDVAGESGEEVEKERH